MKKIFCVFITVIIVFTTLLMLGCKKEQKYDVIYNPLDANSLDELFEHLVIAKVGNYDENDKSTYFHNEIGEFNEIVVPNVNLDDLTLHTISVYSGAYYYTYRHSSEKEDLHTVNEFRIKFSRSEISFQNEVENSYLNSIDGKAYDPDLNAWLIDYNGNCIVMYFPTNYPAKDLEITDELLSFTRYKVTETGVVEITE